jgi:Tfp pilus assembly protein PilZ
MWDGFDKRRFPRINLQCEITIESHHAGRPVSAITENIGCGGVCVLLEQPLERFERCSLKLELSENMPRIETAGKVVWIVPTRDLKSKKVLYDTGIEFDDVNPDFQRSIRDFLEKNASAASE